MVGSVGMTLLSMPSLKTCCQSRILPADLKLPDYRLLLAVRLGFEICAAAYLSAVIHPRIDWAYFLLSFIEETLEMSGVVLVILALLRHVRDELGGRVTAWNRVVLSVT